MGGKKKEKRGKWGQEGSSAVIIGRGLCRGTVLIAALPKIT
jgi:hypothetical protein